MFFRKSLSVRVRVRVRVRVKAGAKVGCTGRTSWLGSPPDGHPEPGLVMPSALRTLLLVRSVSKGFEPYTD